MINNLLAQLSTPLQLPEYGRNIQKMVSFIKTIESRKLRNEQAQVVIGIMTDLSPYKRDSEEFRHMLWDHLFMIANFDLDIDSPYPIPLKEQYNPTPAKLPYSKNKIYPKQYGKYAKEMLSTAASTFEEMGKTTENQEDLDDIALDLAKFLKQKSFEYNESHPNNKQIIEYVKKQTNDTAQIDNEAIDKTELIIAQPKPKPKPKSNNNNKSNNNKSGNNKSNNNNNKKKKIINN